MKYIYFSSGNVINHFLDKTYQEINFKCQLNSVLCIVYCQICTCLASIYFKRAKYKSHWNMLVSHDQWEIMSDLNMSYGKMSGFVSFPLLGFTLVVKLRNFDFEGH